ncbi:MAG: HutP family protein [Bacillota bacterium]|nr:HutP family protein [Bacillota bacterium]
MPDNLSVGRAAVRMAISLSREEEARLKEELRAEGIAAAAVDLGGDFVASLAKMVERAIVAARREGVIRPIHAHEGAVAGAAREALGIVGQRALGFNIGGKLGVARGGGHLAVAVFAGVGLVYLDDVALGLAHRAVPE